MLFKQKIGKRLMIGIQGPSLDKETRAQLKEIFPGGVIIFSRNIRNPDQVARLIKDIKEEVQPPPLIAIDQEGGLVIRFFRDVTVMPGNMALGAIGSPELAYKQGRAMAEEIKPLGIDINLAPVVDVATNPDNPGITIRSFGSDPKKVGELAVNFIRGTQSRGVGAVAKHFPGKGEASKDAHFDLPKVDLSWDEMNNVHLVPFQECIKNGVKGVMSSHVIYSKFPGADKVPATFAPELIKDYLRGELGFNGVIFSDDLEMGAITKFFSFEKAVVKTLQAGHDMILVCSDYEKQRLAVQSIKKACEEENNMLEEMDGALNRIDRLRNFCQKSEYPYLPATKNESLTLSQQIAERSITLIQGEAQVPISLGGLKNIVALIPDLSRLESIEEGFEPGESNFIGETLKERLPISIQIEFISLDPSEEEVGKVWEKVKKVALVLAFIFNAKFLSGQRLLLEKLKAVPQNTIFILIRNPFDLDFLNSGLTTVITYGYRKVQIAATIEVLAGAIPALGKLPV